MKLSLQNGQFVLLPQTVEDVRLLADHVGGVVSVEERKPSQGVASLGQLTGEAFLGGYTGDSRSVIASTGQLVAKPA